MRAFAVLIVLVTSLMSAGTGMTQPVPDHLKCYKVKDSLAKGTYKADLGGLAPEQGCLIKVPGTLLCVQTAKTNVSPAPPGGPGGTTPAGRFLCYKVRCPKAHVTAVAWRDQFGTRTVTPANPTMLCAPEITSPASSASGCFVADGDGTVHDSCTGLQWEKKDTIAGHANPADLHDVDNLYTWAGCCGGDCRSGPDNLCQPNAAAATTCAAHADGGTQGCATCASGTCNVDPFAMGAITTVWDWLNRLNAANFAGHSDWRLPSEEARSSSLFQGGPPPIGTNELETILLQPLGSPSCARTPCIDPIFGPTLSFYWSASTQILPPGSSNDAWLINFNYGAGATLKDYAYYVRAVR